MHGSIATLNSYRIEDYDFPPEREYTLVELENAFAMIQPKDDWRGRIQEWITLDFYPIARAACRHYTATDLRLTAVTINEDGTKKGLVTSIGYREGPAGP